MQWYTPAQTLLVKLQEARLLQRGRATLLVGGDFAKSLIVTQGHSKLHRWVSKFLLVFQCNYMALSCFRDKTISENHNFCHATLCMARHMPSCGIRPSVHLSLCPSVTFVYFIETSKLGLFSNYFTVWYSHHSSFYTKHFGNIPTETS